MANLDSTSDIKKQVLKNCGELTDGNSQYDQDGTVLAYIWDAYLKVLGAASPYDVDVGEPWSWAKSTYPLILQLNPKYDTGGITLTKGSTAGVFSSVPAASLGSFANWYIKVDGLPEFPRIATHTAGTANFTLDANYNNDDQAAVAFKVFPLDYSVGSITNKILRLCGPAYTESRQNNPDDDGSIYFVDQRRFRRDCPFQKIFESIPDKFTEISEVAGVRTIRFNRYPPAATRVEIDYIPYPAKLDDSEQTIPIIPVQHMCVLEYAATYRLMLDMEDDRAAQYLSMTQAELKSMMAAKRKENHQAAAQTRGQMVPRADLAGERQTDFRFRR